MCIILLTIVFNSLISCAKSQNAYYHHDVAYYCMYIGIKSKTKTVRRQIGSFCVMWATQLILFLQHWKTHFSNCWTKLCRTKNNIISKQNTMDKAESTYCLLSKGVIALLERWKDNTICQTPKTHHSLVLWHRALMQMCSGAPCAWKHQCLNASMLQRSRAAGQQQHGNRTAEQQYRYADMKQQCFRAVGKPTVDLFWVITCWFKSL